MLKQSVGSTKAPEYNPSSDFYIKSLIEQIEYLKEENKIKNSVIQSLLHQNPSSAANSALKQNKILPKGVKRSLSKIITNLVSMLAVKEQREIQNLNPKLMILPVRTLKRQMQKRQDSY